MLRGVERKKELPEADAEDNPKKETMKENLVYEILGVVSMSIRLKRTIEDKISWGIQLRELLQLPKSKANSNIVREYLKDGTQ